MKEILQAYRERPEFIQLMHWLKAQHRLPLPRYSPDGDGQQWDRIKYATAHQDGFDLLYFHLTGEKE